MEGIIKATWEVLAKSGYTDNLNKWRKHGRPVHVTESIWARWNEAWGTAEFRARFRANRRTEKAGPGTGPSRHTGGSISFSEHVRRIVSTLNSYFNSILICKILTNISSNFTNISI